MENFTEQSAQRAGADTNGAVRPTAYGYARVSRMVQVISGHGLEAQYDAIRRYCEFKGLNLAGIYTDSAESGRKLLRQRPKGEEMCVRLKPGEHVVMSKLDRGFRNARDCLNMLHFWKERNITCHFADIGIDSCTPVGNFFVTMLAAFAEWEHARISERTREALAKSKAKGRIIGIGPPGWVRVPGSKTKLRPHPEEQWVLSAAMAWRSGDIKPNAMQIMRHISYQCRWCQSCVSGVGPDENGKPRKECPVCGKQLRRLQTRTGHEWTYLKLHRGIMAWLAKPELQAKKLDNQS